MSRACSAISGVHNTIVSEIDNHSILSSISINSMFTGIVSDHELLEGEILTPRSSTRRESRPFPSPAQSRDVR